VRRRPASRALLWKPAIDGRTPLSGSRPGGDVEGADHPLQVTGVPWGYPAAFVFRQAGPVVEHHERAPAPSRPKPAKDVVSIHLGEPCQGAIRARRAPDSMFSKSPGRRVHAGRRGSYRQPTDMALGCRGPPLRFALCGPHCAAGSVIRYADQLRGRRVIEASHEPVATGLPGRTMTSQPTKRRLRGLASASLPIFPRPSTTGTVCPVPHASAHRSCVTAASSVMLQARTPDPAL